MGLYHSRCVILICVLLLVLVYSIIFGEKMMEDAVLLSFLFTFHMSHSPGGNYTEELQTAAAMSLHYYAIY